MIEGAENTLQIAVLLFCSVLSLYRAVVFQSRTWTLLALSYGSWVLADLYWLFCVIFTGNTPQVSAVADLSWYVSLHFLYLALRQTSPPETAAERRLLPWLGPLFTAAMAVFFIRWGEILSNLIYAGLMGLLLYAVITRLMERDLYRNARRLSVVILIFCLLTYAQWISSCLWRQDTLQNPYYWFEFLTTACFPFFLPATRKAVAE